MHLAAHLACPQVCGQISQYPLGTRYAPEYTSCIPVPSAGEPTGIAEPSIPSGNLQAAIL